MHQSAVCTKNFTCNHGMLLVVLASLRCVFAELREDNVCTFNQRLYKNQTVTKTSRRNTTTPYCYQTNALNHCTDLQYYMYVKTSTIETVYEDRPVQACCPGYVKVNDSHCQECEEGQYGWQCQSKCHCPVNSTCDNKIGTCICFPGWTGHQCDEECPDGYYGANCSSVCQCESSGDCNTISGECSKPTLSTTGAASPGRHMLMSVLYYGAVASPALIGLVFAVVVTSCVYRRRKRTHRQERNRVNRVSRGARDDYEMIDEHVLSNEYVEMPDQNNQENGMSMSDSGFQEEAYYEIHIGENDERYTEVTNVSTIVDDTKVSDSNTKTGYCCKGDYDTVSRPWQQLFSDNEEDCENTYNHLDNGQGRYDTFQSVKTASSMTSLPAYMDDDYSNVGETRESNA